MKDPVSQREKAWVTSRLKEVARNLSRFADSASSEQQRTLLGLLEEWQLFGLLEHWERRKTPRKPCALPVRYVVEDKIFTDMVTDISSSGAFVRTCAYLAVGQPVTLIFSPDDQEEPVNATGRVVRTTEEGVGVQFKSVSEEYERMIENL
ncbi:MAG: PilZ domain-containing protein [Thermodesulfobacteriota bacterium]|nr:PilZ domain-containing protein [Thermodesulfobacteriota bacterium]